MLQALSAALHSPAEEVCVLAIQGLGVTLSWALVATLKSHSTGLRGDRNHTGNYSKLGSTIPRLGGRKGTLLFSFSF